eukprot:COSAG01_NODE_5114_length_4474_cov_12.268114_4_plen_80_part_00
MMDDGDAFKLPTITTMNLLIREARRCVGRPAPPPHQTNRAVVTGNPDMQRPFLSRNIETQRPRPFWLRFTYVAPVLVTK